MAAKEKLVVFIFVGILVLHLSKKIHEESFVEQQLQVQQLVEENTLESKKETGTTNPDFQCVGREVFHLSSVDWFQLVSKESKTSLLPNKTVKQFNVDSRKDGFKVETWYSPVLVGNPNLFCNEKLSEWHKVFGRGTEMNALCNQFLLDMENKTSLKDRCRSSASPLFDLHLGQHSFPLWDLGRAIIQKEGTIYCEDGFLLQGGNCCYCGKRSLKLKDKSQLCKCFQKCWCDDQISKEECGLPRYEAVLSISTVYGSEFAHFMKEVLPRIAPVIQWVKANPHVHVHVKTKRDGEPHQFIMQALVLMGVQDSQIIWGELIAEKAFVPLYSSCGVVPDQFQGVWATRQRLLERVFHLSKSTKHILPVIPQQPNLILILVRTNTPRIWEKNSVKNNTEELIRLANNAISTKRKFKVQLFSDDDHDLMDCFPCQILAFRSAAAVIAVHGAGLSWTIFMQPKSLVIELAWKEQQSEYLMNSHAFGQRYFLVDYEKSMKAEFAEIETILTTFLE